MFSRFGRLNSQFSGSKDVIIAADVFAAINKLSGAFDEFVFKVDKKLEMIDVKVEELKIIIVKQKSAQEQENIMTFEDLLRKHQIKTILNPSETLPISKPLFTKLQSFRMFESNELLMNNDALWKI